MKVTRNMLLIIIAALGVLLIAYGLLRQFTGFGKDESWDKYVTDIIIISALGLFLYNRKLAKDEKLAKETAENTALQAEEPEEEADSPDDENLPHWERNKSSTISSDDCR